MVRYCGLGQLRKYAPSRATRKRFPAKNSHQLEGGSLTGENKGTLQVADGSGMTVCGAEVIVGVDVERDGIWCKNVDRRDVGREANNLVRDALLH
ncbi:hypothetical protein Tco_1410825 [Tanacetum coccineum]